MLFDNLLTIKTVAMIINNTPPTTTSIIRRVQFVSVDDSLEVCLTGSKILENESKVPKSLSYVSRDPFACISLMSFCISVIFFTPS